MKIVIECTKEVFNQNGVDVPYVKCTGKDGRITYNMVGKDTTSKQILMSMLEEEEEKAQKK